MRDYPTRTIDTTELGPTPEGPRVLVVTLSYYARRGYSLYAHVETRSPDGARTSWPLDAVHERLDPAPRYNAKVFQGMSVAPETLARIKQAALAKDAESALRRTPR